MIDFIKENKNLTSIFEEVESMHKLKKAESDRIKQSAQHIEEVPEFKKTKPQPFYVQMCEYLVSKLDKIGMKYNESLVKVNITFAKNSPCYRLSFPLIETSEEATSHFVSCLKESIEKFINESYQVNLCMKKDNDTLNIVLMLDEVRVSDGHKRHSERGI